MHQAGPSNSSHFLRTAIHLFCIVVAITCPHNVQDEEVLHDLKFPGSRILRNQKDGYTITNVLSELPKVSVRCFVSIARWIQLWTKDQCWGLSAEQLVQCWAMSLLKSILLKSILLKSILLKSNLWLKGRIGSLPHSSAPVRLTCRSKSWLAARKPKKCQPQLNRQTHFFLSIPEVLRWWHHSSAKFVLKQIRKAIPTFLRPWARVYGLMDCKLNDESCKLNKLMYPSDCNVCNAWQKEIGRQANLI